MTEYCGIDVGTSFIKAGVFDLDTLELRRTERVAFPEFVGGMPPLYREADPAAVMCAVEDLLARLSLNPASCGGLLFCGQMHGVVLVNGRGEAVSNYISWLDQRVSPAEFEEISARVTTAERNELGNEFRPDMALSILYWLRKHKALPPGGVTPLSIPDFVAGRLCGTLPAMEPTQAAALGAMPVGTLRWHDEVIGKLGLESLRWPDLRSPGSVTGAWRGVPCYVGMGDQQTALAGAPLGERELSLNISTGSQVAIVADCPPCADYQTRPYFDGRLLQTIHHIPAGRSLSALIELLTEIGGAPEEQAWRHIERAVASVPATDVRAGIAFHRSPCGYGGFLENLHEGNLSVGHVFRAAFESMARNYEDCARRIDPRRTADRAVLSGGVARRLPVLRRLIAEALGLPYRLSRHPEDTLFGMMVLALAFSGRCPSVQAAGEMVSAAFPAASQPSGE